MKQDFRDLLVWQKAMSLVIKVYLITKQFPREERYGLISQVRRAAVSVPSNIAEGQARPTRGEFLQFLGHAKGSLAELETQLLIANSLGYIHDPTAVLRDLTDVQRMLCGLVSSLTPRHR
jgi:four helix bundle protein